MLLYIHVVRIDISKSSNESHRSTERQEFAIYIDILHIELSSNAE